MARLEVYEPISLEEAKRNKMEIVYTKWLDDEKPTASDPEAVRSRLVATQVNNYSREDVTQATPPIKVARMVLSMAASARDHQGLHKCLIGRHDIRVAFFHAKGSGNVVMVPAKGLAPPGTGWRALKAMYGTREASKCWGNEVTDTMLAAGCTAVGVVPMTFVHEGHGYVVECHGDDFLSCGSAQALDQLDHVLTEKFDTKVLARIGPPSFGGQATEGPHLGRLIRWTPEGFEWEANPKHAQDLMQLVGLKQSSKGADVPIAKTVGKGMRTIIDELTVEEATSFRQGAGTGLYLSIDRPSLQFAMGEVMSGMQTPLVKHKLMLHHLARYVVKYPSEVWLFKYQEMPKVLRIYTDSDWAGNSETRKSVSCAVERYGSHMLECTVGKQSVVALSSAEAEFYAIVRGTAMGMQSLQIVDAMAKVFDRTAEVSLRISSDSSAARAICNRIGSGKVRHLSIKELWIQEEVRQKRLALDSVDTSMNWADVGTKAHPKDRLDSLMSQLPLRRQGGITISALSAVTLLGAVAGTHAKDAASGVALTGSSQMIINLETTDVMKIIAAFCLIVILGFTWCRWTWRKIEFGAAKPAHVSERTGAATTARAGRTSGAAQPAREMPRQANETSGAIEATELPSSSSTLRAVGAGGQTEPDRRDWAEPADRDTSSEGAPDKHRALRTSPTASATSAERAADRRGEELRDLAARTTVLERYTLKALQQQCRSLGVPVTGLKADVVRRLAGHMINQDYSRLVATGELRGMSVNYFFETEGALPSSDSRIDSRAAATAGTRRRRP